LKFSSVLLLKLPGVVGDRDDMVKVKNTKTHLYKHIHMQTHMYVHTHTHTHP
jgi:hypothetical protein